MPGVSPEPPSAWRRSRRRPSRLSPAFWAGFPAGMPLRGLERAQRRVPAATGWTSASTAPLHTSLDSSVRLRGDVPGARFARVRVLFSAPFPERAQQNSYLRAKRNAERGESNTFIHEDFTSFSTEISLSRFCLFKSFFRPCGCSFPRRFLRQNHPSSAAAFSARTARI